MTTPKYLSNIDILQEIRDWIIILVPFAMANQGTIVVLSDRYLHVPSDVLAFLGAFFYFLYLRMRDGQEISKELVAEAMITAESPTAAPAVQDPTPVTQDPNVP